MPVAVLEAPTKQEIEEVKAAICHLFPHYQYRRLELGLHLLHLQDLLAQPGYGKFMDTVSELGIPRSTCYDLIDFAKDELHRLGRSENRNDDGVTFEWDELDEIMREARPEPGDEEMEKQRRKPKPYVRSTQLHLILDRDTRLELATAWAGIKKNKGLHKALSQKIAKVVIDAAVPADKKS